MAEKMKMPDPAVILLAMKNKGKMQKDALGSKDDQEADDGEEYDHDEHLQEIAKDFLQAIKDDDAMKIKELLQEAFECMSSETSEDE